MLAWQGVCRYHHEPEIVLDVAHNPHSAEYLVERVKQQYLGKNIHIVVAMLHDKDIKATIEALTPVAIWLIRKCLRATKPFMRLRWL